ncbi:MAG TPA: NAD-dependent epimerase/dehydratase family protein, partial [Streptosporangiaceae bacterium]
MLGVPRERVLVTGSSGHLGEALVRVLRGQGRDVVGLDLLPSPYTTVTGPVTD